MIILVLRSNDSALVTTAMMLFLMTLHLYVTEINFERKLCKRNSTTIEQVINNCAILDIV